MKFDLDTAWKDTTTVLRDNLRLLAVVAGVFYFVPYLAALLWIPGLADLVMGQFDPESSAMEAKVNAMFANYWWALVILGLVQGIGFLAMLALLRRRANPTVAQALQVGTRSVLSYIATSLLLGLVLGLAILLAVAPGAVLKMPVLVVIGAIVALVVSCYLFTKFSIVSPVIAIDEVLNPFAAMGRSWRLTKNNSLRLFFFFALLFIAYAVISAVVSMVFSLIFALGGAEAQTFGQAFATSLMNALFAIVFAGVLAAVHAQLSRLTAPRADRDPLGE